LRVCASAADLIETARRFGWTRRPVWCTFFGARVALRILPPPRDRKRMQTMRKEWTQAVVL